MDSVLHDKLDSVIWAAYSLFQRGKMAGFLTSMSFRYNDFVYINANDPCFGTMSEEDFTAISLGGIPVPGKKPNKGRPLHLALYEKSEDIGAVIHTHSTHSALRASVPDPSEHDCVLGHTLYLKIRLDTVGLVLCKKPGPDTLSVAFKERVHENQGYLLRSHDPVVPGKIAMDALYCPEELEESARVVWELYRAGLYHL